MSRPAARHRVAFIFTHRIQYFTNLLDELVKRGRIEVLAIESRETRALPDEGFERTIDWDNRRDASYRSVILSKVGVSLEEVLRDFKPDLVHLNGYSARIQFRAWRWCRRSGVGYFLRGDGDTLAPEPRWKSSIRRLAIRPIVSRAETIFYQGEENRRYWIRAGASAEQLVWVPCVSDSAIFRTPAFAVPEDRQRFRGSLGAQQEDAVFVVSGKLESRKRPADVLEAVASLLRERARPVRLWYLGSGPLEAELRRRVAELGIEDRVNFLGFRNQTELPAILQAADALIHPSGKDPWPYSVLDAAISGLALILSDRTGSYPDWIKEPAAATVFQCGNVQDLRRRLNELLENPAAVQALGKSAREKSEIYRESVFCEIFEASLERRYKEPD